MTRALRFRDCAYSTLLSVTVPTLRCCDACSTFSWLSALHFCSCYIRSTVRSFALLRCCPHHLVDPPRHHQIAVSAFSTRTFYFSFADSDLPRICCMNIIMFQDTVTCLYFLYDIFIYCTLSFSVTTTVPLKRLLSVHHSAICCR